MDTLLDGIKICGKYWITRVLKKFILFNDNLRMLLKNCEKQTMVNKSPGNLTFLNENRSFLSLNTIRKKIF